MGKSKFPGKPSKSQNKKHISVLTGEVICEGDVSITNDKLSVLHKTFSDQDEHSNDSEPSPKLDSPTLDSNDASKTNMPKESSKCSTRIKNQQKNENANDIKTENTSTDKKHKKSVTFRRVLESYSDSVGNKKKKPFINYDLPLVSIIKKNTNTYKSEGIVKPSKLSDISTKFILNSNPLFNQKIHKIDCSKDKDFPGGVGGFILPAKNVHSSWVVKSNKRFMETEATDDSDTKIFIKKPRLPLLNDEACENCDNLSPKDEVGNNNNSEMSGSKFLWHSLRPNVDKLMFSKKLPVLESVENDNKTSDQASSSDSYVDSSDEDEELSNDSGNELDPKSMSTNHLPLKAVTSLGKNILRKATLQLQDTVPVGSDGPFSASSQLNNTVSTPATVTCGVCGAVRFYRFARQARKFGIYSCESCRKFISKMVKKQTVTSLKAEPVVLQCHKGDGQCHVPPIVRSPQWKLLTRCAYKARCPACWLKMCLRSFQIQPTIQSKLIACLPQNMREAAKQNLPKLEVENSPPSTKLFPSRLCLTNVEQENNNQKIIDTVNKVVPKWSQDTTNNKDSISPAPVIKDINEASTIEKEAERNEHNSDVNEDENSGEKKRRHMNVRVRKKSEPETKQVVPAPPADTAKRQRIDLKGPRVKHVCRSASIVLGQPLATFSNEGEPEITEPDSSPIQTTVEISEQKKPDTLETPNIVDNILVKDTDTSKDLEIAISTPIDKEPASAPLSDIVISAEVSNENSNEEKTVKSDNNVQKAIEEVDKSICNINNKAKDGKKLPVTKSAEPSLTITKKAIRNINSISYYNSAKKIASQLLNPISVDFWENYDPAEVSRAGFGLIGSDFLSVMSICFLCGASGTGDDKMIYCSCCCQPYHRYCVEDNIVNHYYGSSSSTDLLETSLLDCSVNSLPPHQNGVWRLNWLCPRCTVCQSCGQVSGSKLSCRKCHRSYHSKCVNTKSNKQCFGSDRPWICPPCFKCKSCGSASVAKYIGNMPLCSGCFKLRQKGSFCPLCQRCYEDNDFNTKMMECGECKRWIHAHCEGLSDEKYQLLSILPESIEFVCRKCFVGTNSCWREAIDLELKNGFQTILRALSKNRDACALLKWSPRKKTVCACQPIFSAKSIKFNVKNLETSHEDLMKCSEKLSEYSISTVENKMVENAETKATKEIPVKLNEEQSALDLELQNAVSSIEFSESWKQENEESETSSNETNKSIPANNCYCTIDSKNQAPSLLDIKRKVLCNEYSSLSDFNKDMIKAIEFTKCEDLYHIYNSIVHDSFPWFTNDPKTIVENKYNEEFDQKSESPTSINTNELSDQEVPVDSIPFDGESYFYDDHIPQLDLRLCLLCKGAGDGLPSNESRLLYCGLNEWVHANCALWSAEVFEEIDGSLQNVHSAISRGKLIRCTHCHMKGASVGCCARNCSDTFHYPCARNFGCAFMDDKTVYCPQHVSDNINKKSQQHDKDFEINRPVYVELDRKKKKILEANRVQFRVGSLHVKNLGKFVPPLSDTVDSIIPINFICTRMFWSTKEPWKIIEYTIKTSIYIKKPNMLNTLERNFTVDHSQEIAVVQCSLNEIKNFHRSIEDLDLSNDILPLKNNKNFNIAEDKTVKIALDQMLETVCRYEEEIYDEEPQNTADLLSPELEDEIYEDLQDDLLDGISMLDLFPKLMNYEDFASIDSNSNRDLMKEKDDSCENRFDILGKVRKDVDNNQNDSWFDYKTSELLIDDLFPTSKCSKLSREFKRSKSEVLPHTKKVSSLNNRVHQRSCSLSWNYKVDGNPNFKRRKILQNRHPFSTSGDNSQMSQESKKIEKDIYSSDANRDLDKKGDSLDRNKFTENGQDNDTLCTTMDDIKAAVLEKIKISQLDGADDTLDGSEYGSPDQQVEFNTNAQMLQNNYITNEIPVKCNRCQCTYRNQDSYHRHLPSCESLTSESESENSHSPDQGHETININQDGVLIMQNLSTSNAQFIPDSQTQNISNVTMQMSNVQNQTPISILPNYGNQINFNSAMIQNTGNNAGSVMSFDCTNNLQNVVLAPGQGNIQFGQTSKPLFSHPQTIQIDPNQRQQQNIIQDQNVAQFQANQTNIYPLNINQIQNQIQNNPQIIQTLPNNISINQLQNHPTIVKAQNGVNYQLPQQTQNTNQPRIITFSNPQQIITQNSPQIQPFTIGQATPMLNFTVNQPVLASPQKKQLILPHITKTSPKRQAIVRMPIPNNRNRSKTLPKPNNIKRAIRPDKPIISNQGIQLNRPLIIQQGQNQNNPIIVQQLPSAPNVMSYVEALQQQNSNVQFIAVNSDNDFKQPTQYITANPLVPGTFQIHTDQGANLLTLAPNGGLSVLPNMQLAQPQPTVLGTILQPQSNGLQCGMLSESLVLQPAPLEMVTDASGCMYLTSQPVYYGLETIVQNTVMQSQQFVSTAMQGMLASNSSFSATTTQVFQASKIEPIVEVPSGYVVVNNVQPDGIIQQTQQNLIQALQPTNVQPNRTECISSMAGPSGIQTNNLPIQINNYETIQVDQKPLQINANNKTNNLNIQGSGILLPKTQNQFINKVLPGNNIQQPINICIDSEGKIQKTNTKDVIQQIHFGNKNIVSETSSLIPCSQNSMQFSQIHFNKPNVSIVTQGPVAGDTSTSLQKPQAVEPRMFTNKKKDVTAPVNKMIKTNINNKSTKANTHLVQPIQNKSMPLLNVDCNPPLRQTIVNSSPTTRNAQLESKNQIQQIVQPIMKSNNVQCTPKVMVSNQIQLSNNMFVQGNHAGIPTNIVNPIQQVSSCVSNTTPARPMNRVLPMQTTLHKENSNNKPAATSITNQQPLRTDCKINNVEPTIVKPITETKIIEIKAEDIKPQTESTNKQVHVAYDNQKTLSPLENLQIDTTKRTTALKVLNGNIKNKPLLERSITYKINNSNNFKPSSNSVPQKRNRKAKIARSKENDPKIIFEVHSQDGFTYSSSTISDLWLKVLESVQKARKTFGLAPLPQESIKAQLDHQILGLDNNALRYLLEQLPDANKCQKYKHRYHKPQSTDWDYDCSSDLLKENASGAVRCEPFKQRSEYDMFSWLASKHRQRPLPTSHFENENASIRRATSTNLPIAMRYRYLKETSKESVGVFRSLIHGRGLFCRRDIESGEMVIEYAGEVIRATLTDKREKYYDGKGIGCYMFRIDDQFVVDATMRGNAARFINHSCEPNCYSKVIDVLGHKHIVIFALRRILQGEELTYDYKFPFEDVKIPCSCGSRKCRKYLN